MKLFIPAVGYRIVLTKEWNFVLYHEYRNQSLLKQLDPTYPCKYYDYIDDGDYSKGLKSTLTSFPPGTKLEIDRVYIRSNNKAKTGSDNYDSISFKVVKDKKSSLAIRFWVKLEDANQIEYELPTDTKSVVESAIRSAQNKVKKLDASKIRVLVRGAAFQNTIPSWYTPKFVNELELLTTQTKLANVKRFERYCVRTAQDILDLVLFSYNSNAKFKTMPTGRKLRTFISYDFGDITSNFWCDVYTNSDDTEIVEIHCGSER